MFGNGVRIGMAVTAAVPRRILLVRHRALAGWFGVAAGTPPPGSAGWQIATTTRQATATATSACASPFSDSLLKEKKESLRVEALKSPIITTIRKYG